MSYQRALQQSQDDNPSQSGRGLAPSFQIPKTLLFSAKIDETAVPRCVGDVQDLLDVPRERISSLSDLLLQFVHSNDKFRVLQALEQTLRCETTLSCRYRWCPPKGTIKHLLVKASVVQEGTNGVIHGLITEVFTHNGPHSEFPDSFSVEVLKLVGDFGLALDVDLRILAFEGAALDVPQLFGEACFQPDRFTLGSSLLQTFSSQKARERVAQICDEAVAAPDTSLVISWQSDLNFFQARLQAVSISSQLLIIVGVRNISQYKCAAKVEQLSNQRLRQISFIQSGCEAINGNLQAILSYASVLSRQNLSPLVAQTLSQEIAQVAQSTYGVVRAYMHDLEGNSPRINYSVHEALIEVAKIFVHRFPNAPLVFVRPSDAPNSPTSRMIIETHVTSILEGILPFEPRGIELGIRSSNGRCSVRITCQLVKQSLIGACKNYLFELQRGWSDQLTYIRFETPSDTHIEIDVALPPAQNATISSLPTHAQNDAHDRVLLVGGDKASRSSLGMIVSDCGFRTVSAEDGQDAVKLIRSGKREISMAIVDTQLHDIAAPRLLQQLRRTHPMLYLLGVVSSPSENTSLRRAGALATVVKPFEPPAIRLVLSHVRKLKLLAA